MVLGLTKRPDGSFENGRRATVLYNLHTFLLLLVGSVSEQDTDRQQTTGCRQKVCAARWLFLLAHQLRRTGRLGPSETCRSLHPPLTVNSEISVLYTTPTAQSKFQLPVRKNLEYTQLITTVQGLHR